MGATISQVGALFVNRECLPLNQLLEKNRNGLILLLVATALVIFLIEAFLTLAILSCAVRDLRLQGLRGFGWRLGGCLFTDRRLTTRELEDLERTKIESEPTSVGKGSRRRRQPESGTLNSRIVGGVERYDDDGRTVVTEVLRRARPSPLRLRSTRPDWGGEGQTVATPARGTPRRQASNRTMVTRATPRTAATSRFGGRDGSRSGSNGSAAQRYAASHGADEEEAPTLMQQTSSPTASAFPSARRGAAPTEASMGTLGDSKTIWTKRKR